MTLVLQTGEEEEGVMWSVVERDILLFGRSALLLVVLNQSATGVW